MVGTDNEVLIQTKYGNIVVRLRPDKAPLHCDFIRFVPEPPVSTPPTTLPISKFRQPGLASDILNFIANVRRHGQVIGERREIQRMCFLQVYDAISTGVVSG